MIKFIRNYMVMFLGIIFSINEIIIFLNNESYFFLNGMVCNSSRFIIISIIVEIS